MSIKKLRQLQFADGKYLAPDGTIVENPKCVGQSVEIQRIVGVESIGTVVIGEAISSGLIGKVSQFAIMQKPLQLSDYELLTVQYFE